LTSALAAGETFLDNHVKSMVSVDYLTVPTIRFQFLYVFLVLAHPRRRIRHFGDTAGPTAEWTGAATARGFPWETTPHDLLYVTAIGSLRRTS
jgi:hypothetical protein